MSRDLLPLVVPDASQFAKALGRSLHERHDAGREPPGHVELLNLMARALGHRNLQSLQAATSRSAPLPPPVLAVEDRPPAEALTANARKALMQFDSRGRLMRWPTKFSIQALAMWMLWTWFDGRRVYSEREVNDILKAAHVFGDHVTLRRELVNHRLLTRKSDCSEYRKLPARPDAEVQAMLRAWRVVRSTGNARGSTPARRSTHECPPAPCGPAPS